MTEFTTKINQRTWDPTHKRARVLYTSDQIRENHDVNFTVEKAPVYASQRNGAGMVKIADRWALQRTDNDHCFDVVGNRYQPFQHSQMIELLDSLIPDGIQKYNRCTLLNQGKEMILEIPLLEQSICDEPHEVILVAKTSHGSGSISMMYGFYRMVCLNGMHGLVKNKRSEYRIQHTTNMNTELANAKWYLSQLDTRFEQHNAVMSELINKRLERDTVQALLNELVPKAFEENATGYWTNQANALIYGLNHQTSNTPAIRGTAYSALQGVTYATNHSDRFAKKDKSLTYDANYFGSNAEMVDQAVKFLLAI